MISHYSEVIEELKTLDYKKANMQTLIKYKSLILKLKNFLDFLDEKVNVNTRFHHVCRLMDLAYGLNPPYNIKKNFNSTKNFIKSVEKKISEEKILEFFNAEDNSFKINISHFLGTHSSQTPKEVEEYILFKLSICERLLSEYNEIISKKVELLEMSVRNLKDDEIKVSMDSKIYLGRKREDGIEIKEFYVDDYYFNIYNFTENYTKEKIKSVIGRYDFLDYFGKKLYPNLYI